MTWGAAYTYWGLGVWGDFLAPIGASFTAGAPANSTFLAGEPDYTIS